jgi:hypothetical protein
MRRFATASDMVLNTFARRHAKLGELAGMLLSAQRKWSSSRSLIADFLEHDSGRVSEKPFSALKLQAVEA